MNHYRNNPLRVILSIFKFKSCRVRRATFYSFWSIETPPRKINPSEYYGDFFIEGKIGRFDFSSTPVVFYNKRLAITASGSIYEFN